MIKYTEEALESLVGLTVPVTKDGVEIGTATVKRCNKGKKGVLCADIFIPGHDTIESQIL